MGQENAFDFIIRNRGVRGSADLSAVSDASAQRAQRFHGSFPGYAPTPLHRLDGLAGALDVGRVYVKDESRRFDLNAFKVLGGGYAMGC